MKYYIISGEASGDLHGSNLMRALKQQDQSANFRFWGGDEMESVGGKLVKHYRDLAFMGFVEVVKNLRTIFGNISFCKKDILTYQPDALVLIDYPGFNLRIAKWAKTQGIKVFYYISPQIWAWHSSRVHGIKSTVDEMMCILPFEKDFYAKHDYEAHFVGHPLLDVVSNYQSNIDWKTKYFVPTDKEIIAVLPGSRKQEIKTALMTMLEMVNRFPNYHFVIAAAPSQTARFYHQYILDRYKDKVSLVQNSTYSILQSATAALVTSGTATLEAALFDVPQVVCYKASAISYQIAKLLVNVKYISLVNLIMDQEIVTELIQKDFNPERLEVELRQLLDDNIATKMKAHYSILREKLGNAGASERAARVITSSLGELYKK